MTNAEGGVFGQLEGSVRETRENRRLRVVLGAAGPVAAMSPRNPYDATALLIDQQPAGLTEAKPVVMYNPPWTLALAMPFGAMNFALARSLWLALQMATLLWCASRLWLLYGGEARYTIRACCVA